MKKTFFLLTGVLFVLLFLGCPNATETPKSNNADLQSLEVSDNFSLDSAFDAKKTDYTVTVPYATESLTITGKTADSEATMDVENVVVTVKDLKVGVPKPASIKVTAEDGTEKIYTVIVIREAGSSNADLQSLIPSTGNLSSAFNADTLEYTITVLYATKSLKVTGKKADANATMDPVDGELSFMELPEGTSGEQTITVTAEDGKTKKEYKVKVTRCEELEMLPVPAGSFQRDEVEENISVITKPYYLGKNQITRKQFKDVMGVDPSDTAKSSGMTDPVQMVSWYHAIAFCNKLSLLEGLTPAYTVEGVSDWANLAFGDIPRSFHTDWDDAICDWGSSGYRLPTEMEWMWAAMGAPADGQNGGTNTTGYLKAFAGQGYGAGTSIDDYAWYKENSDGKTHPVGKKLSNELGLYDMSGNVMEWCWDWKNDYPSGLEKDYKGADSGSFRQSRGGSWGIDASGCSFAYRYSDNPYKRNNGSGFRVLRPVLQGLRASTSVSESCAKAQQAKHERGAREALQRLFTEGLAFCE